jgi:organic radical activating enzyme
MAHRYHLVDGKIHSSTCEINVAEHCNLSCRGCSHLSPVMDKYFVDPSEVMADLSALAHHYGVDNVRLLGGEPLLHPDLLAVISAVRASAITERVTLVTNGLLLARMPGEIWEAVDTIEISMYPGHSPKPAQYALLEDLARSHAVDLRPTRVDKFRESFTEIHHQDPELTQRIFSSCKVAHQWRCHTVAHGMFYRCPQSYFLPKLLGDRIGGGSDVDGLKIEDDDAFGDRLVIFLNSEDPPESCANCLGTAGRLVDHVQIRRKDFMGAQDRPAAAMVARRQLIPWLAATGRNSLMPRHRGFWKRASVGR